jgi:hypothetical protein
LRRFQIIYKLFTVFPSSVEHPDESHDLPKSGPAERSQTAGVPSKRPHWEKMKSLTTHARETCQRIYTPGTHLCIDEIMLAYEGRSKHTTKLKNKPIKERYKNWALAEHGYIWNWLWHSIEDSTEGA